MKIPSSAHFHNIKLKRNANNNDPRKIKNVVQLFGADGGVPLC
jgi:hypothetical protein